MRFSFSSGKFRVSGRFLRLIADIGFALLLLVRLGLLLDSFWVSVVEALVMSFFIVDAVLIYTGLGRVDEVMRLLYATISPRAGLMAGYVVVPIGLLVVYFGFFYSSQTAWVIVVSYAVLFLLSILLVRYVPDRRTGWMQAFLLRCPLGRWLRDLIHSYPILLRLYDVAYLESQVATVFALLLVAPIASCGGVLFLVAYGLRERIFLLIGIVVTVLPWILPFVLPRYVLSQMEAKRLRIKEELPWFLLSVLPRIGAGHYYVFDESIVDEFEAMRFEAKRYRQYYHEGGADYIESLRKLLREAPPIEEYRSFLREYIALLMHPSVEGLRRWASNWLNMVVRLMNTVTDAYIEALSYRFSMLFTMVIMLVMMMAVMVFIRPAVVISLLFTIGLFTLIGGLFGALLVHGSAPSAFRFELRVSYVPFLIGFVVGVVSAFFVGVLAIGVATIVAFFIAFMRGRVMVAHMLRAMSDLFRVIPLFVNYLESGASSDLALASIRNDIETDRSYSPHFKRFLSALLEAVSQYSSEEVIERFRRLGRELDKSEYLILKTFPGKLFVYTVASFRERVERDVALMIESVFRNLEEQWKRYQIKLRGLRLRGLVLGVLLSVFVLMVPAILLMFSGIHGFSSLLSFSNMRIGSTSLIGGGGIQQAIKTLQPLLTAFITVAQLKSLLISATVVTVLMLCLGLGLFQDVVDYGLAYPRWSMLFMLFGLVLDVFFVVKGVDLFMSFVGG